MVRVIRTSDLGADIPVDPSIDGLPYHDASCHKRRRKLKKRPAREREEEEERVEDVPPPQPVDLGDEVENTDL